MTWKRTNPFSQHKQSRDLLQDLPIEACFNLASTPKTPNTRNYCKYIIARSIGLLFLFYQAVQMSVSM